MKIVILGSGLLGKELKSQTGWDILSHEKDGIDANHFDEWMDKLQRYDIIINCIANTDTYSEDKTDHINVNYRFVTHLVKYCNEMGKKLVHISTDYVYSNSNNPKTEEDVPVHHSSWYGYSKLLSDAHVELECERFLLCRLSHKPKPFPYNEAWGDVLTNADYTPIIVGLLVDLINENVTGVYNVGTEEKTIYELAKRTKLVGRTKSPPHVPKNNLMNISKLQKFLIHLWYDKDKRG